MLQTLPCKITSDSVRRIGRWTLLGAVVFLLLFEVWTFYQRHRESRAELPEHYGSFEENLKALEAAPREDEFAFAACGDSRGSGVFRTLAAGLREEPLSFLISTGDFVRDGREIDHQHFAWRSNRGDDLHFPFPVLFTPGNHDHHEEDFSVYRFEEIYGPTLFTFEHQDCLFVFLRTLEKSFRDPETLEFLRRVVDETNPEDYRYTFVITHIPLPISPALRSNDTEEAREILRLIDELGADYVLSGDHHAYFRASADGINHIATGGGGAPLKGTKWGRFNHAMVFVVRDHGIEENILYTPRVHDYGEKISKFIALEAYPWLVQYWPATILINIALIGALLALAPRWNRAYSMAPAAPQSAPEDPPLTDPVRPGLKVSPKSPVVSSSSTS